MKIGILRESKTPPDKRVPLTPAQCAEMIKVFPGVTVAIQPSASRCFSDEAYRNAGVLVRENLVDCDILMGVKEVNARELIENKKYLFFSHTIKKQSYNRHLLQEIVRKNIQLIDYETLTDKNGARIIGFGRFAGLVGTYSGLRAYGLKNNLFRLKPAHECKNLDEMLALLKNITLPPVKIAVTGDGRVAGGVLEILNGMNIMRVTPEAYLRKTDDRVPVFVQLLPVNYVKRKDDGPFELKHFFVHPEMYENGFLPYSEMTDILITAAYWDPKAPVLFTKKDTLNEKFKIQVISDITCDIDGSVPTTVKASTIDEPFYDFNPETGETEIAFSSGKNITVQAVDNLPCELPVDASEDFGRSLIDKVFPALLGDDPEGIIERATITKNGSLTERFSYLEDYIA